jgi:hypothetical protein
MNWRFTYEGHTHVSQTLRAGPAATSVETPFDDAQACKHQGVTGATRER